MNRNNIYIFLIVLTSIAMALQGCDKLAEATSSSSTTIDSKLVGVWYSASSQDGMQIGSDGSITNLSVDGQGKLIVDPNPEVFGAKFKTAADGKFEWDGKRLENGQQVSMNVRGRYSFSSDGSTLTTNVDTVDGQAQPMSFTHIKKNLGDIVTGSGAFDSQLIAAWYDASNQEGIEIKSDGTFKMLDVDTDGKLQYANYSDFVSGRFTKASGGTFEATEIWMNNGQQETINSKGTYSVTNSGNNLTVVLTEVNGQPSTQSYSYVKKTIGELVITPNTTIRVSITMDGQTYTNTSVQAYVSSGVLDVSAWGTSVSYFNLSTTYSVGVHTIDGNDNGLWFEMASGTTYTSDTGTIVINAINGKNVVGSFSLVVQDQANSSVKKNVTGGFNVNLP